MPGGTCQDGGPAHLLGVSSRQHKQDRDPDGWAQALPARDRKSRLPNEQNARPASRRHVLPTITKKRGNAGKLAVRRSVRPQPTLRLRPALKSMAYASGHRRCGLTILSWPFVARCGHRLPVSPMPRPTCASCCVAISWRSNAGPAWSRSPRRRARAVGDRPDCVDNKPFSRARPNL